jgi:hypothetical protein
MTWLIISLLCLKSKACWPSHSAFVGFIMYLNYQAICTYCCRSPAHGHDQIALPGCMGRVDDDREFAQFFYYRDCRKIKCKSCIGLKCPNSSFTKDDLAIALRALCIQPLEASLLLSLPILFLI